MWKVLVVEDDPMLAEIHRRYIDSHEEFQCVQIANTIECAWTAIEEHTPDLLLLDVYLPQTTGIEFLMQLREEGNGVDVILISSARRFSIIEKAFQYGAIDYLIKPFEFDRLKEGLDTFKQRKLIKDADAQISQSNIDDVFLRKSEGEKDVLPKGLHERTLERVKRFFKEHSESITIEVLAEDLCMSKVTLRRYLKHLETTGFIDIEMFYGSRGRPSYVYKRKNSI